MEIKSLASELNTNSYPGRGIVLGQSDDGKFAVCAYFIMGRSVNSRNRIFEENERGGIRTKAFDESKMEDPSLIIYNPVLKFGVTQSLQTAIKPILFMILLQRVIAITMHLLQENLSLMHQITHREFQVL